MAERSRVSLAAEATSCVNVRVGPIVYRSMVERSRAAMMRARLPWSRRGLQAAIAAKLSGGRVLNRLIEFSYTKIICDAL